MTLREVGFFSEFNRYGKRALPSIRDYPRQPLGTIKGAVLDYLLNGKQIRAGYTTNRDVLAPGWKVIQGQHGIFLTDGAWVWPIELAYYVKNYEISLPTEFIDHIQKMNWVIPENLEWESLRLDGEISASDLPIIQNISIGESDATE